MAIDRIATIQDNLNQIGERIAKAATSAGRNPDEVRLVVVTKAQPVEVLQAVIAAGAQVIGENYAEEAVQKVTALGGKAGMEWHMIGHVQSRKARLVSEHFDLIHSLDSTHLAVRINQAAAELQRVVPVLLEFNLGGEESKSGWTAVDDAQWEGLQGDIEQVLALPSIRVCGLMTMPPLSADPENTQPFFARLRKLQTDLARRHAGVDWRELSMGTSADFEVAIQEGATLVRIGTAIVGPRPKRV
jgi:PLP dependent protein